MSRPGFHPNQAERREAAAAWLVRLEGGEATEADWLGFEAWLGDPDNKSALDEIETALSVVDDHREAFRREPKSFRVGTYLRATVLVGLVSAAAAALFLLWPTPLTQSFSLAAPAHATRTVTLADGTNIVLNRGALLRLRWSQSERYIELARGEAAFRVTHDPNAPLILSAGDAVVRDLGTEFNVLREGAALTVTVRAGAVNLTAGGHGLDLAPGDQARLASGRLLVRRVDPDAALAWREGRLVYRDAALSDVVADLNRYSDTPIQLGDARAAQLRFSGVLIIADAATMASALEAFLPVHSDHNAAGIVIRSRASRDTSPPL